MRIAVAQINPTIGDLIGNTDKIIKAIKKAQQEQCQLILFPELCLTGYPPEDLLLHPLFIESVEKKLQEIIPATQNITALIGFPRKNPSKVEKNLYNSVAVITDGRLAGYQDKMLLPTYDVFDERRYFEPGAENKLWTIAGKKVAITICEDLWQHSDKLRYTSYKYDPISDLKNKHPDIIINLSASPYSLEKSKIRLEVGSTAARSVGASLILCNQVGGNDSLIFDGNSFYVDKDGNLRQVAKSFNEDFLVIDTDKKNDVIRFLPEREKELYDALVLGIRDYFHKSGFKKACLGLSGGIDSALVACLAVEALGKENVVGIGMPSRYSSKESVDDAVALAKNLGMKFQQISIEEPYKSYLDLLTPHFDNKPSDVTEENLQARVRGMILMALSNKLGYIVLSTGNKSELAMGYATLYGDMCGGLAVISDVTKKQVYALSQWINRNGEVIPKSTMEKPPSAELRPNQKDSDSLPDYDIIDNVIQDYVENYLAPEKIAEKHGYPLQLVKDLVKKIHYNEYKRRQSPVGLRVSEKSFLVGRRFPVVQKFV